MERRRFVRDSLISVAGLSKLLINPATNGLALWGATPAGGGSEEAASTNLFPTNLPGSKWVQFSAAGFSHPVTGVIYRKSQPATNGMPLGGVDTGCIDLETSGLWGYSTIFNSHVPRRGPLNLPFLGLSVGGQTWVMCDPKQIKQYQTTDGIIPVEPYNSELQFDNVRLPKEIHYWGHYPIVDMEFDTDAPISVGLRAWSPFLPGDLNASLLPGMVLEVHLRNASASEQQGTVAFSFNGPSHKEAGADHYSRHPLEGAAEQLTGVVVNGGWTSTPLMAPRASYALGVVGQEKVRLGGELGKDGEAWAKIAQQLPEGTTNRGGSSAAVDFELAPGATRIVRFLVTWHSPQWKGGGNPASDKGDTFTHMYALRHRSAPAAVLLLAREHASLLRRILAWQEVIYSDATIPGWLQDSLINNLHLITETGLWAAAEPPLPDWVRPEDGLFGMDECPRGCPQIECIPCSFYGNIPVVYFFPELALSTLRGYKGYMYPEGAVPWIFGGATGGTPPLNMNTPTRGYQLTTNGICYAALVDRYALCWGHDKRFAEEFYESVKRNTIFTINLRPEYAVGDRVISMPTGNEGTEWFEADKPGWSGMVAHVGGLHLAELRIAQKMAEQVGDQDFARQCREWIEAGMTSMETKIWTGSYYLNFWEPESGTKSDLVFGYQMDGQWVADFHGLSPVFQPDRAKRTLETIKRCNVALSKTGAANYAHADGSPAPVGGYGTYSYFPPEVLMLAMTYMYAGQREFGLDLARRCWENITCTWRYTWDAPNIMRGDKDTGESVYGHDYYQDMMLWSLPAALAGQPMDGVVKPGGLVDRILKAAGGRL
jgi:uncharacterized protein (DUF608 family)